jgi:hypothetical protein
MRTKQNATGRNPVANAGAEIIVILCFDYNISGQARLDNLWEPGRPGC